MDPTACLASLLHNVDEVKAAVDGDHTINLEEALESLGEDAQNLLLWLKKGGFRPKRRR